MTAETNAAVDLIFGYTGKQLDDATTYQHNLNRWYDSNLGQWLNEDPKGFEAGDANLRRYVSGYVTNRVDNLGLEEHDPNPGLRNYIVNIVKSVSNSSTDYSEHNNNCSDASANTINALYDGRVEDRIPANYSVNAVGVGYTVEALDRSDLAPFDFKYWAHTGQVDLNLYSYQHNMVWIGDRAGGYLVDTQTDWVSAYTTTQNFEKVLADKLRESYFPEGLLIYTQYAVGDNLKNSKQQTTMEQDNADYKEWFNKNRLEGSANHINGQVIKPNVYYKSLAVDTDKAKSWQMRKEEDDRRRFGEQVLGETPQRSTFEWMRYQSWATLYQMTGQTVAPPPRSP